MCLQISPPHFQIFWNLPLDSLLSYLHGLADSPPPARIADFLKSATGQFAKLPTCACRFPLALQIFWNLLLDTLLCYLHVLADSPPVADFLNSATGHFAQLPTCACRFPPPVADFLKSATVGNLANWQFAKLPTCACRFPPIADFLKSATGQFAKLPTWACRFPSPCPGCRFSQICHWTVC